MKALSLLKQKFGRITLFFSKAMQHFLNYRNYHVTTIQVAESAGYLEGLFAFSSVGLITFSSMALME